MVNLSPVRVNISTHYLVFFQRSGRGSVANEVLGQFLDKEDVVGVLLELKKGVNQCIVLANILQINM